MILAWLIIIPFAGGIFAWALARGTFGDRGRKDLVSRWISLLALALDLFLVVRLWVIYGSGPGAGAIALPYGKWFFQELFLPWIPQAGISIHLAMDGLSLLLVTLTLFLGIVAVAASWREIRERTGFFHFTLLWTLAGIIGVFQALDLFLFYFFWEMMLVPMYFLIAIWGHERRLYASVKFFIFTQLSGLFMLLSILGLFFIHGRQTGVYTFDYTGLLGTQLSPATAFWLMLGFFIAFAVKLPAVPVHSWLPDAHTEAPTAGSIILAGLLLKTGAYGLLRFAVPLFPGASAAFAPVAMALGVISILYGAFLAYGQTDLKRLVADTSISHMGFVLLGIYAWNGIALQGTVMQMLCHGISTGMLFVLAGAIQERIHTRDMRSMGRFWEKAPVMGGVGMVFALASLGLPGLGNFIGEFLVLLGAFRASPVAAVVASLGLIFSTVYALWMVQQVFHGEPREERGSLPLPDFYPREAFISAAMIILIVWLGLYPQPVINAARPALENIQKAGQEAGQKVRLFAPGFNNADIPAGGADIPVGPMGRGEAQKNGRR